MGTDGRTDEHTNERTDGHKDHYIPPPPAGGIIKIKHLSKQGWIIPKEMVSQLKPEVHGPYRWPSPWAISLTWEKVPFTLKRESDTAIFKKPHCLHGELSISIELSDGRLSDSKPWASVSFSKIPLKIHLMCICFTFSTKLQGQNV